MLSNTTDQAFFYGLLLLQAVGSYVVTRVLCRRATGLPKRFPLFVAPSILPSIFLLFAAWMMFGMGRITDIAAIMIAATLFLAFVLALVGWVAMAVARKLNLPEEES